jgi:UDP-N-acetylmuramate: L-alanyl-gamma-D-glutamyl-meso-diaminopimelate ligase
MSTIPKKVHIIGICGVATSALAIAFHKRGVKVTGSDKGFYPPVSTHLDEAGVSYYAGWHPENISTDGDPDLIIAGGVGTSLSNPEVMYAKEHGIPLLSFAEALGKYIIKEKSIVVTGTWGKTTTSALLSYILIQGGFDPSYFTGGLSLSHDTSSITEADISVVEGDEYQIAIWDKRPKFAVYRPTHLILTSVSWDHADLYPTEEAYFQTFENLIKNIPSNGVCIACTDDTGVNKVLENTHAPAITYGKNLQAHYRYDSINTSREGLKFTIHHTDKAYTLSSPMFGRFNVENITAAFALAHSIGMPAEKIIKAIHDFKGIKRRFEKRLNGDITVFDCHAPTPEKAMSVLENIREVYTKENIFAVYEPNIGGRQRASAIAYDNAFKDSTTVIIPRLTKLKVAEDASDQPMEGIELADRIKQTQPNTIYLEDDVKLIEYITSHAQKNDVIVFLGSHGFRGMIEEVVEKLKV